MFVCFFVCLCFRQETLKQRGNIRASKVPSNVFVCFFIRQVLFVCLFVSQPRDSRTEVECTKVAKGQPGAERTEQEGQKLVSRDELSSLSCSGHLD